MTISKILSCPLLLVLAALPLRAQDAAPAPPACACPCPCPEPPPPPLQGSLGAGLAITSGNTDTSSFNLGFDLVYDPKTHGLFKADVLYLRSSNDGVTTTDKAAADLRYEYRLADRIYAFVDLGYLRDRFKNVTYLVTPMVGGGYYFVRQANLELTADVSVGGAFEKDSGYSAESSGAYSVGQGLLWKISPGATFTEKATGLWKTSATSDSFYHLEAGLASTLTKGFDLKVAYLVDVKNRPEPSTLKKTDTALIASLLYKF